MSVVYIYYSSWLVSVGYICLKNHLFHEIIKIYLNVGVQIIIMQFIPALLIGIGLFIISYTVIRNEKGVNDLIFQKNVLAAIVLIGVGSYVLFYGVSSVLLKQKFIGLLLTVFGFYLTFKFPYCNQYNRGMDGTAIFFGIIILIVGLIVLIF